jgi:hypothetical protein
MIIRKMTFARNWKVSEKSKSALRLRAYDWQFLQIFFNSLHCSGRS